jgi:hypothetical protein
MREDEIMSVARFKLGETARRLAILAESASDADTRATLLELSAVLLSEQNALDQRTRLCRVSESGPLPRAAVRN